MDHPDRLGHVLDYLGGGVQGQVGQDHEDAVLYSNEFLGAEEERDGGDLIVPRTVARMSNGDTCTSRRMVMSPWPYKP